MANRTLRVLHVEDSERDVALLTRHLSRVGYDLISKRVETPAAMKAALEAEDWDVILCDYSMPQFNALSALALLKERSLDIPFIIISGTIGEEVAVEAMRAGAHDYLMKDNLARLAPAIERELHEAENRHARRRVEEALRESEDRYRDLVEHSQELICTHDLAGRLLSINPWAAKVLGYDPEDLLKQNMRTFLASEFRDQFDDYLAAIQRDGFAQGLMVVQTATGKRRIWEYNNSLRTEGVEVPIVRGMAHDITERKQAEEELRQRESQLAEAQHLAHVGSWNWDLPSNTLSWSDEHFRMFGLELQELTPSYELLLKYVHPDDRDLVTSTVESALRTHEPFSYYLRIVRPDGDVRIIHSRGNVTDEHGNPTRMFGTVQDVTERKEAEAEQARLSAQLESQRQRLNKIVANVPGIVWETCGEPDVDAQRISFVSDYVETMLGYSVEEWLSTPDFWLSIVHPDDKERMAQATAADFATGKSSTLAFRWVAKDGRILWVESNSAVITDDEGRPIGLRGVTTDISERKRTEESLRESEERYRLLFASNPQPMWVFDLETLAFLEVNDAAIHHYGYAREEFLSMTIRDIRPAEDLPKLLDNVSGGTLPYEEEAIWRHKKKDGTIIDVEITVHSLDFNGRSARLVLANDVTERKALEEQLRQSQKMEAIGILAGGIAHDFNNLLTVITGYSDLTTRRLKAEDPLRHNLEEIKKAGERAALLTRQLLAFSRKQVLQPKVLDLNAVVSDLEKMLGRVIGEDVGLRTVLDAELGSIKVDPGQIEQIIMNLAVNARDAMPQGGKLTIETKNVYLDQEYAKNHIGVTPGSFVMLAVSDTGTGMDQQTQARIFEPFFTTKETGKGTGLGLSTVYGIVKQSGGNIWVYSEVGQGTTFKVYLPRVNDSTQEYKGSTDTEEITHGTETILLAEDEEMVRKLACKVLEMDGYKVLEAANGGAALLICERHKGPIHLLVTDVIMPEMSGRELAGRLAQLRPEMKVLYMSGYTDNAIVHHGVLSEGTNFIQKPFPTEALERKVREVLDAPNKIF